MCNWVNGAITTPRENVFVLVYDPEYAVFSIGQYNPEYNVWEFDDGAAQYADQVNYWWSYLQPPYGV